MKKRIIFIICLLLIVSLLFVFFKSKVKEFEIVQKTNGGVPYNWEYEIEDKDLVELVKIKNEVKNKNVAGGRINKHYIFKALKKGKTTITFRYVGVSDEVIEIKTYDINIDKNLKVTIKEHDKDTHFEIVETKNTNVDYKWDVTIDNETIVELTDTKEEPSKDKGADIVNVKYIFNALEEGTTFITFEYISNDEKDIMETLKYKVIIDKSMNITILEQ